MGFFNKKIDVPINKIHPRARQVIEGKLEDKDIKEMFIQQEQDRKNEIKKEIHRENIRESFEKGICPKCGNTEIKVGIPSGLFRSAHLALMDEHKCMSCGAKIFISIIRDDI